MALVVACNAPSLPPNAEPIRARPQYALWWGMTETCSGMSGELSGVHWFVEPGTAVLDQRSSEGDTVVGVWFPSGNEILLAESAVDNGKIVRHEMLHALLQRHDHPPEYFVDRCEGFVSCGPCVVRPEQDPGAEAVVDVRTLQYTAELVPGASLHYSENGGWFAVVAQIRNPRPEPIWAALAPLPQATDASATFGFAMQGGDPLTDEYEYVLGNRMAFDAGETRLAVFDLRITRGRVAPGEHVVHTYFNADSVDLTFVVSP